MLLVPFPIKKKIKLVTSRPDKMGWLAVGAVVVKRRLSLFKILLTVLSHAFFLYEKKPFTE